MDIRNNYIGAARSESVRNGYVNGTTRPSGQEAGVNQVSPVPPVNGDRVEISDAARSAAGDQKTRELAFARKALEGTPQLSQERINEIQDRIKSGYYNDPEVLRTIAEKLTKDLTGTGI